MSSGKSNRPEAKGVPCHSSWLSPRSSDEYSVERHGRLVSASRPVADLPFERFLQAASGQERFFWRDGRQGITFAGSGVAAHLIGYGHGRFAAIQRQASEIFKNAIVRLPSANLREETRRQRSNSKVIVLSQRNASPPVLPAVIRDLSRPFADHPGFADPPPELALPRLFGGFAFREDFVPDMTWTGFHPGHFILPHYQFVEQDGLGWLTINALSPPEDDATATIPPLEEALDAMIRELARSSANNCSRDDVPRSPQVPLSENSRPFADHNLEIDYPLRFDEWAKLIENALLSFDATPLKKVVLSRIAQLRAPKPLIIRRMLTHLCADYPDCFSFLFEPQPGHAFLGATPELLVRVRGVELETMALAGSMAADRPLRAQAEVIRASSRHLADRPLAAALLASAKDRHEHALVVKALRAILQPLCRQLNVPAEPAVLALSNIQHLYTPVKARLNSPEGVLPLVEALHPTPAMGGTPRELGMAFIRGNEPTLRGWYAAPVGWIDCNMEGAFAVAIRSAVVQKERAWAYAGAGIVPGSVPQAEWEETNWKFQPIISIIREVARSSAKGV